MKDDENKKNLTLAEEMLLQLAKEDNEDKEWRKLQDLITQLNEKREKIKNYNIQEQKNYWEELKKEWDDKCTYWKPDNSIKGRIKAKLYTFLLKLCERLNPSKDYHDKLVNDANRFMDDKLHKNFYDDKVGYIDLDNMTKEEQDKLIQRGKEISNDLQ